MADSNTTTYSFTLPEVGASADSWGTKLNANWDKVDDLLDGSIAVNGITVTGGSIDGTPVGATTPSTGEFTTLTTTGNVDVTGTVTADGLTVETAAGTSGTIGLLRNSSSALAGNSAYLDFKFDNTFSGNNVDVQIGAIKTNAGNEESAFVIKTTEGTGTPTERFRVEANGDVSFYEDTGTTAKMVWDASAESLNLGGIATANTAGFSQNLAIKSQYPSISLEDTSAGTAKFTIGATNGNLGFWDSTASAYRMTIDSSGNVGIGVTPSSAWHPTWMDVVQIGNVGASIYGSTTSYSANNYLFIANNSVYDGTNEKYVRSAPALQATLGSNEFRWNQAPSGTAGSNIAWNRSMTLDASGNLLVGTTASSSKWVAGNGVDRGFEARGAGLIVSHTSYENQLLNTDNITAHIRFYYRGSATGSINTSGSGTVYATTSDYRLKENVVSMDNASDRVKALKPCRFNFIADPDSTVDGFLAHEAQEVVPEAVTGAKDAMKTEEYEVTPAVEATYDEDGNELTPAVEAVMGTREVPDYQGIDQSKLVPLLTKALQEALTRIEALENANGNS